LARALAARPEILLLDEPFGALDAQVRQELRRWLRNLHDAMRVTSVFVTHDQDEAFEVSDRVVILNKGRIEQVGSPEDIFHHPANAFVMNFLGNVNIFQTRFESDSPHGILERVSPGAPAGAQALYVRPHDLSLSAQREESRSVSGRIVHIRTAGLSVRVALEADLGCEVQIELSQSEFRALGLSKGDKAFATPKQAKVFSDDYSI
jgi:sulfate transport system ATP-binding protein